MVGRFTDDADAAIDEITAAIAFDAEDMDYGVWSAESFLLNDTPDELGITGKSTDDELDAIARELTTDAASYDPPILADPDEIASELYHWRDKLAAGYIDGSKEPEAEIKWGEWQFKWSHGKRTVEAMVKDDDDEK